MFYINVWLTVHDEANIEKVKSLLAEAAGLSRQEPGCHRFEVYHSENEPTKILLIEHWEDKAAWEKHREEKAFLTIYQPQVLPLVDREPHFSQPVG